MYNLLILQFHVAELFLLVLNKILSQSEWVFGVGVSLSF